VSDATADECGPGRQQTHGTTALRVRSGANMAGAEALKRRVAKLVERETAALLAIIKSMTEDERRQVLDALHAMGYPLPAAPDNPWSLPLAERQAYAAKLEALRDRPVAPAFAAKVDTTLRVVLTKLLARRTMA